MGDHDVCIVSMARTPVASFGGRFKDRTAVDLGIVAARSAIERANISPEMVEDVYFGNVLSGNLGQAPAKQVSLGAGVPPSVPCTTVNKVCASGMKSIEIAALNIASGTCKVALAGGFESMSKVPRYVEESRFSKGGRKYGDLSADRKELNIGTLRDGLARDGLSDPYSNYEPMGAFAVQCAVDESISRQEQDEYAAASYARSKAASKNKKLSREIVPLEDLDYDEECFAREVNFESLSKLKPAFKLPKTYKGNQDLPHNQSVTAGNASTMNDGAAALILASRRFCKENGLPILATIKGWGNASQIPEKFTSTPALATEKALTHAGLELNAIEYFEINEAFSIVPIVVAKKLGFDWKEKNVNVYGGAVSIGHPLGMSGARITMSLVSTLLNENGRYGVAAICNGGGGASALVIENENVANSRL